MSSEVELKQIKARGDDDQPPPYTNNATVEPTPDDRRYTVNPQVQGSVNPAFDGDLNGKPAPPQSSEAAVPVQGDWEAADEEEREANCFVRTVERVQTSGHELWLHNRRRFWSAFKVLLLILYFVYFGFAMDYSFGDEASIRLLWVTCVVVFCMIIHYIWKYAGKSISEATRWCWEPASEHSDTISWVIITLVFIAITVFVIVDVTTLSKKPYNLVSLSGIAVYLILFFIFSHSPAHVQWRAVAWGLGLQFVFALFILRWDKGYDAFRWLGDRVTEFLLYTDAGSEFIFGTGFREHFFAFQVLPTIVFFSTAISVLYYLGVMQVVIRKVAWVMQTAMGTTAGESLNAAGNIFVGQTEAPLLIRPLLKDMTRSEIHAVMTGGFATIAGGVLGAYISFGVPPNHLISASVMSAPAALALSKLFYPETEKSKTTARDVQNMEPSKERNIVEAASAGASASIRLVANVAANLIAFIALLAFLNTTLTWFGNRVGIEELTFEFICSYVLWPFAFVMGVETDDCRKVARLIGIKTFLNEFIAYEQLSKIIKNEVALNNHTMHGGNFSFVDEDVVLYARPGFNETILEQGIMSDRSVTIATYALCGFSNIGSIGIQLGGLGGIAPDRKSDLASVAIRAMIAGNVACFLTACIAGLFYQGF